MAAKSRVDAMSVVLPKDQTKIPWVYFKSMNDYFRLFERYPKEVAETRTKFEGPDGKSKIVFEDYMLFFYVSAMNDQKANKQKSHCTRFNHNSGRKECTTVKCTYLHACFMCNKETHSATSYHEVKRSAKKGQPAYTQIVYDCPARQGFEEEFQRLSSFYDATEIDLYNLWSAKPSVKSTAKASTIPGDTAPLPKAAPVVLQEQPSPSLLRTIEKLRERISIENLQERELTAATASSPLTPRTKARRSSIVELATPSASVETICDFPVIEEPRVATPLPALPLVQMPVYRFKSNDLDIEFTGGKVSFGGLGQQLHVAWAGQELSTLPLDVDPQNIQRLTVEISYIRK